MRRQWMLCLALHPSSLAWIKFSLNFRINGLPLIIPKHMCNMKDDFVLFVLYNSIIYFYSQISIIKIHKKWNNNERLSWSKSFDLNGFLHEQSHWVKYIYIFKKIVFSVLCISSTYYKRIIIIIEGLLLVMFFGEYIIMMYYQTNEKRRREKTYQYVLVLWLSRGEGLS